MTVAEEADRSISIADPDVGDVEREAVERVLNSGQLADGEEVRQFESEFAAYCGGDHAVATANGTAALHTALEALGIGEGDAVLTTPFTFVATANAIRFTGAEPVFADVDRETLALDPDAVEAVLEDRDVAAIVAVHLYGTPAPMTRLEEIADRHGAALVEDAAQAHGATYRGEPVGAIGDVGCFSFYPTKNMTTGEGGMVVTDRSDVAERAASFVDHGRTESYHHVRVGQNYRMTSMAAAIGRVQLDRLPGFVESRRENAARLTSALADGGAVEVPAEPDHVRPSYNQYTVRTDHREPLQRHLREAGVDTGVYYATPVHDQPAYREFDASAPVAERAADRVLSLPVHPGLDPGDVEAVATAVKQFENYA